MGARHVVVTDVNDYRLGLARKMGATRAINVTRESLDATMKELGMQEGFDVGLEMSGNAQAFREMLRTMHHGGSIAILGILPEETAIDWNQVIFKGLTLKGIYGREMFETWYKMSSLLQSGLNLDPIITHHFPVQDYHRRLRDHGLGQVRQGHPRLVDAVAHGIGRTPACPFRVMAQAPVAVTFGLPLRAAVAARAPPTAKPGSRHATHESRPGCPAQRCARAGRA